MIGIIIFSVLIILIVILSDYWYKVVEFFDKISSKFKKECKVEIELIKKYKILSNKIKCNKCGDIIESTHRHDYKCCKCDTVSVDGGKDYLKRNFKEEGDYEELSETIEE